MWLRLGGGGGGGGRSPPSGVHEVVSAKEHLDPVLDSLVSRPVGTSPFMLSGGRAGSGGASPRAGPPRSSVSTVLGVPPAASASASAGVLFFLSLGLGTRGFPPSPRAVGAPNLWVGVLGKRALATPGLVSPVPRPIAALNIGNGKPKGN